MLFERCAVIGIGMIGGSFALAAKREGLVGTVVDMARTESTLRQARDLSAADETTSDAAAAVEGADLVYLAAPVGAIPTLLRTIANTVPEGCLVTDAGSTKREIVAAAADLPAHCAFIGGHPMAGSEQAGIGAADPDLFRGCSYFLTPDAQTNADALALLRRLVEGLGAEPIIIDADEHDRVMAATSHLPHMLAAALCATLADFEGNLARVSGPGLRDSTRVALGPEDLWRDILLSNADNVTARLAELRRMLDEFEGALRAGDGDKLVALLRAARRLRERLVG